MSRLLIGLVAGIALSASWAVPGQIDPVGLSEGAPAPFTGVLVSESDFDSMLQAKLDVPLLRAEIVAWERGHALAIESMERSLEALAQCRPKRTGVEKAFGALKDIAFLAMPLVCIAKDSTTSVTVR